MCADRHFPFFFDKNPYYFNMRGVFYENIAAEKRPVLGRYPG